MTDSPDSVKRAWFYCRKCHESVADEKMVVKCECKRSAVRQLEQSRTSTTRRRRKTLSGGGGREVCAVWSFLLQGDSGGYLS